ncbi:hypothetical protein OF83DRAFT_470386 [Amylostereum chailletii]|nr:hypothetical protein OF83DRAFT_470386 [Amylostereum chailletii]
MISSPPIGSRPDQYPMLVHPSSSTATPAEILRRPLHLRRHISELSPETLCTIFVFCAETYARDHDRKVPSALLNVCHRWRDIIFTKCPDFWAVFPIYVLGLEDMEYMLKRVGKKSIILDATHSESQEWEPVRALELALAQITRVRALDLDMRCFPGCDWHIVRTFLEENSAPVLRSLVIAGRVQSDTELGNLFRGNAPTLQSLKLYQLKVSSTFSLFNASSLTSIRLTLVTVSQWRTLPDVLDTIYSIPNIEELYINNCISSGLQDATPTPMSPLRRRVHLPNMKRFVLYDKVHIVRYIVGGLSIPCTSKFRIYCEDVSTELLPHVCDMVNNYFKDTAWGTRPFKSVFVSPGSKRDPAEITMNLSAGIWMPLPPGARKGERRLYHIFSLHLRFSSPGQPFRPMALFSPVLRGLPPAIRNTPSLDVQHEAFNTSAVWRECFSTFRQVKDLRAIGSVSVGLSQALKTPPELFPKLKALYLQEADLENTPPAGRALNAGGDFRTRDLLRQAAKARAERRVPFIFKKVLPGGSGIIPMKI